MQALERGQTNKDTNVAVRFAQGVQPATAYSAMLLRSGQRS